MAKQTQRIPAPMGPLTEEEIRADERARISNIIRADERGIVVRAVRKLTSEFFAHKLLRYLDHHHA